jgi:hypothetical protein
VTVITDTRALYETQRENEAAHYGSWADLSEIWTMWVKFERGVEQQVR